MSCSIRYCHTLDSFFDQHIQGVDNFCCNPNFKLKSRKYEEHFQKLFNLTYLLFRCEKILACGFNFGFWDFILFIYSWMVNQSVTENYWCLIWPQLFLMAQACGVPVGRRSGGQLAMTLVTTLNVTIFFPFHCFHFFFSVATFSHRSAWTKKPI